MRLFGITMLAFILFQDGNAVGENQPIIRSAGTAGPGLAITHPSLIRLKSTTTSASRKFSDEFFHFILRRRALNSFLELRMLTLTFLKVTN